MSKVISITIFIMIRIKWLFVPLCNNPDLTSALFPWTL
uniref:Uncharacterized protein n=1 Tax=Ciona intestinalis TaxID=7719 RepID=H2XWB5_CIOIN